MAGLTWRLGALLCSAGFTMIVSADQIKIPAETGQPVTLPCKLASSSQVIVVQWSRTDLGSDYVLLYRDGRIDPFNQHQSFKNRVDLQNRNMKDGDVSLVLKDVRTEDGGTYECRVVQTGTGRKKILISTISLEVAAPPPGHHEKLIGDRPDQEEDDKHSETAEKDGGTQETPAPTPPAGIKAEVKKDGENDDLEEQKAPYAEPLKG
ncbi:programmed cell death 1 ligand 1-like [Cyprinodon tularosa]|uniref:programmed cell death 1 ligand 1-like n=1 Tax=Cyprinodon tularosa TaxID=77115 RepID=UPI0018E200CA|nr:programmed cell death 1 ligand 1-like [Cyprinodon tularosa]